MKKSTFYHTPLHSTPRGPVGMEKLEWCRYPYPIVKLNGAGCFEVEVWADTAKFTDVIVTRLRKCSDLIREGRPKLFIKNKTKVACRVGCSERAVLYFTELLFKSNKKKFICRRVESEKISSHPRRDLL